MNIRVEVIDHKKQRYETCGDWLYNDKKELVIKVSSLNNWRYELLVAVHEIIESALCAERGIKEDEVTKFDITVSNLDFEGEPGDLLESPYRKEHFFATSIERLFANELGVDWIEYEEAINSL